MDNYIEVKQTDKFKCPDVKLFRRDGGQAAKYLNPQCACESQFLGMVSKLIQNKEEINRVVDDGAYSYIRIWYLDIKCGLKRPCNNEITTRCTTLFLWLSYRWRIREINKSQSLSKIFCFNRKKYELRLIEYHQILMLKSYSWKNMW